MDNEMIKRGMSDSKELSEWIRKCRMFKIGLKNRTSCKSLVGDGRDHWLIDYLRRCEEIQFVSGERLRIVSWPDLSEEPFSVPEFYRERSGTLRLAFVWTPQLFRCVSHTKAMQLSTSWPTRRLATTTTSLIFIPSLYKLYALDRKWLNYAVNKFIKSLRL
jgi:hypothetical protein